MKTHIIYALCSSLLLLNACVARQEIRENTAFCDAGQGVVECLDQDIKLNAELARGGGEAGVILQHPILSGGRFTHQDYLKISPEGQQIILLSTEALSCDNAIQLTGKLKGIEAPCGEDHQQGKCGYSGYYIEVQEYRCP